jgi:peptidoglycan/xylan/chitin deacetylase (PgdA/CDA1 family)
MNHLVWLVALVLIGVGLSAATVNPTRPTAPREVAITFDDLPVVPRHDLATDRMITAKLLKNFATNNVPVIGFVNENKLYTDDTLENQRVDLLKSWLDAGLELGNHTFSHPDLNTMLLEVFQSDVMRGEVVTKRLLHAKGRELRFFRHPFLHAGKDLDTKRKFEEFLSTRGYRIAPVTIDNSEWIFARAYERAMETKDQAMLKRVADAYLPYMEQKFEYFEKQSVALFGYEMKQVLLLHANALNADHFDELARMIRQRGYRFITLEAALTDKAYTTPDSYAGPAGITWLHRWVISQGAKEKIVPDEPRTPEFVLKLAGVTAE